MAKNRSTRKPPAVVPKASAAPRSVFPDAEPWSCPWYIHGCKTADDHEDHDLLALVSADSTTAFQLEAMLAHTRFREQYEGWTGYARTYFSDVVKALQARPVFAPDHQRAVARALVRGLDRLSPGRGRFVPLELFLDAFSDLGVPALRALSGAPAFSPEAVLGLLAQPQLHDKVTVTLMVNLRTAENRPELLEAFATGPTNVRAAAALLGERAWKPDELLKAARVVMSQLSADRRTGLETLEVLGREWDGTLEELTTTLRVLM